MPKLSHLEAIEDGCSIGVLTTPKGVQTWYVRCYWRKEKQPYYQSTRVRYEGGKADKQLAIKEARAIYSDFYDKVKRGISPVAKFSLGRTLSSYVEGCQTEASENDARIARGLDPLPIKYGRGYLSSSTIDDIVFQTKIIREFFEDRDFFIEKNLLVKTSKDLLEREIGYIENRHLNAFSEWAAKHDSDWSPSRITRFITRIRHIWRLSRDDGHTNVIPMPPRPKKKLRERSRRHLKEEEYARIISYADKDWRTLKSKIIDEPKTLEEILTQTSLDLSFQFYAFLMLISYSGIRPWTGTVEKNLPRWRDYQIANRGSGYSNNEIRTLRRNEKDHIYTAIIMPEAWAVLDALEELHIKRGTFSPNGFMFAHTSKKGKTAKGKPILSFKKRFQKMIKELDNETKKRRNISSSQKKVLLLDGGNKPTERIVPYSMRGYFISCRLRYGDMSIEKVAQACGTSADMIRTTYNDFIVEKEFELLTSGTKYQESVPIEV